MTAKFTESVVEDATLDWLDDLYYTIGHAPDIASGEPQAETWDKLLSRLISGKLRVGEV